MKYIGFVFLFICFNAKSQEFPKLKNAPFVLFEQLNKGLENIIMEPFERSDNAKIVTVKETRQFPENGFYKENKSIFYYSNNTLDSIIRNDGSKMTYEYFNSSLRFVHWYTLNSNTLEKTKSFQFFVDENGVNWEIHNYKDSNKNRSYQIIDDPLRKFVTEFDEQGNKTAAIDSVFYTGRQLKNVFFINANNQQIWAENYSYFTPGQIKRNYINYPFEPKLRDVEEIHTTYTVRSRQEEDQTHWISTLQSVIKTMPNGLINLEEKKSDMIHGELKPTANKFYKVFAESNIFNARGFDPKKDNFEKNQLIRAFINQNQSIVRYVFNYEYNETGDVSKIIGLDLGLTGNFPKVIYLYSKEVQF